MKVSFRHIIVIAIVAFSASWANHAQAQDIDNERTRILFLLDASGSMKNAWNLRTQESKWESAKKILMDIADSLSRKTNVEIGLRVYGHEYWPNDRNCEDTKLEVGFGRNSYSYIKTKLKTIKPRGITPITHSLKKAGNDFPDQSTRNIIILMTDGVESCHGDPCEVAAMLEQKNLVLKHFVIGFGFENVDNKDFDCVGTNYNVNDEQTFKNVLDLIMTRILNKTTTQVNIRDSKGKATETDVNMSFYNALHGPLQYDFVHTMTPEDLPDTMSIDPVMEYDLVLHTIPSVRKDNIQLDPEKHNTINIKAPQGELEVVLLGNTIDNNLKDRIKCLVKDAKTQQILNVQNANTTETYLSGKYDLEILTLPRTIVKGAKISETQKNTFNIPTPGVANILKNFEVYGGIYYTNKGKLEKIYDLIPNNKTEAVALQPGKYQLIYRLKYHTNMHSTKTLEFEIQSGSAITLKL